MAEGSRWHRHRVADAEAGQTVQELLTGPMGISRRLIQRLTRSRGITLNGRPAYLGRKLRAGDVVAARIGADETPTLAGVEMHLSIVYEDADVLVVEKPPGVLVHPVGAEDEATLAHGIAFHHARKGVQAKVRPVHRLDRGTSGLLLVAVTGYAHQHLDRQLREGTLEREYLALVEGEIAEDSGVIDAPIGRSPADPRLRAVTPGGQAARTRFEVVERTGGISLVRLRLETGRTHQIRVHLAHLGHPVLGDRSYGGPTGGGRPPRPALHSCRLAFLHPKRGERLEFDSGLPADLAVYLESRRRV
jgi:23S rRNA pseudouridine1911/1915/1917 synthase